MSELVKVLNTMSTAFEKEGFIYSILQNKQLVVLPTSFRGSSKTNYLLQFIQNKDVTILTSSIGAKKEMQKKYIDMFGDQYRGSIIAIDSNKGYSLRGLRSVIVDDLSLDQYEKVKNASIMDVSGFLHE